MAEMWGIGQMMVTESKGAQWGVLQMVGCFNWNFQLQFDWFPGISWKDPVAMTSLRHFGKTRKACCHLVNARASLRRRYPWLPLQMTSTFFLQNSRSFFIFIYNLCICDVIYSGNFSGRFKSKWTRLNYTKSHPDEDLSRSHDASLA